MGAEPPSIDAAAICEPLDSLLAALVHKVDRECPPRVAAITGARELFFLTLKTAITTYRSIRYLCAEKPPDPGRRLEYCISVPPLNRTILDNLFTIIFVLEDFPARCEWYFKVDWRETRIELSRYQAAYGHLPEWQDGLTRLRKYSESVIPGLGLTGSEIEQPELIAKWPNPGAMARYGIKGNARLPPSREFLQYLHDWFYADLSQQAHLGGSGLVKRAGALARDWRANPETEAKLQHYRRSQVGQTLTLMMALASEYEMFFDFGLRERIRYVWVVAAPQISSTDELYKKRYASLLGMNSSVAIL